MGVGEGGSGDGDGGVGGDETLFFFSLVFFCRLSLPLYKAALP